MGRRAVAKLDRFYFVSIQARSAVPRDRSAAAPGAVRRPPQISVPLEGTEGGKGLTIALGTAPFVGRSRPLPYFRTLLTKRGSGIMACWGVSCVSPNVRPGLVSAAGQPG